MQERPWNIVGSSVESGLRCILLLQLIANVAQEGVLDWVDRVVHIVDALTDYSQLVQQLRRSIQTADVLEHIARRSGRCIWSLRRELRL